jgi:hypothetical protein
LGSYSADVTRLIQEEDFFNLEIDRVTIRSYLRDRPDSEELCKEIMIGIREKWYPAKDKMIDLNVKYLLKNGYSTIGDIVQGIEENRELIKQLTQEWLLLKKRAHLWDTAGIYYLCMSKLLQQGQPEKALLNFWKEQKVFCYESEDTKKEYAQFFANVYSSYVIK